MKWGFFETSQNIVFRPRCQNRLAKIAANGESVLAFAPLKRIIVQNHDYVLIAGPEGANLAIILSGPSGRCQGQSWKNP